MPFSHQKQAGKIYSSSEHLKIVFFDFTFIVDPDNPDICCSRANKQHRTVLRVELN
jgi:hypothetical protein